MSRNLVEIIRRHHELGAPTALEVLKAAVAHHGEITDDDRRLAAERSGLPEAAVHGVSTFYDDLLQPRGRRHVRVCTGTACWATTAGAHVDELREALAASSASAAPTARCRSPRPSASATATAAPAVRDGDVIDAGPGAIERVLAGAPRTAREPPPRGALDEPVLLASGHDWAGLSRAIATLTPEELLEEVKAANVRGRGGAGFPAGSKWEFARDAPRASASSSSPTATRATRAPTSTRSSWSSTPTCCSRAWRWRATPSAPTTASS